MVARVEIGIGLEGAGEFGREAGEGDDQGEQQDRDAECDVGGDDA
jgi:hypothetical protein